MQELIKKLTDTVGLTEAQAVQAIDVMTNFIKDKVPPMMHAVIDNFIGNDTAHTSDTPDILND